MRQYPRITLLLLFVILAVAALGESPKSLYKKGQQAEARQDYIAAFGFFRQAYEQKPTELKYRVAYQRTRFFAAAAHIKKGQALRDSGDLQGALSEFQTAAQIDPSSFIAEQEEQQTQAMIDHSTATKPPPPPHESDLKRRIDEAGGPVELEPISNQPITLEISNDSKMIYETIGKLAGINVLFDPDYTSRRITLKLNSVSLQESLDILAFHSSTFWRPVTRNTIYVAPNTPAKRKELEQNVLKTFYLSNVSTATDLQDINNVLRTVLDITKTQPINSQNAIVVRDTPDKVALAGKVIGDLDKAKPEVIVEIAIMQVRRDKLRNLGISPPSSASVTLTGPTSTTTTPSTNATTTPTTTATTPTGSLTLNTFTGLKATDFAVSIPTATLNALLNDDNSKLIQNPQIRASDGMKASLKIGDRVPIATGSVGNPLGGTLSAAAGFVNTQFQYIDVGVNIDITPRVFQNRDIGLKLALDVSSVTGTSNIGGISQPIISQRKIEHDIRLKEGEVNLLGGIFEQQDTTSVSGIPGLSQLPFLKYLFSSEHKEKIDNEIVFILIPHIVRAQELTELNQRAIDIGTSNYLDLRRVSRPTTTNSSATAQTPGPQSQNIQTPPTSGVSIPTSPQQSSGPTTMLMETTPTTPTVGSTFTVNVMVSRAHDLYSAPMVMTFDPNVLQLVNISNGDLLSKDGQAIALVHREESGTIQANATRPPGSGGINGDGTLYAVTFQAKAKGPANLNIRPAARNSAMQIVPIVVSPFALSVQ